jgi:hypothetical protein
MVSCKKVQLARGLSSFRPYKQAPPSRGSSVISAELAAPRLMTSTAFVVPKCLLEPSTSLPLSHWLIQPDSRCFTIISPQYEAERLLACVWSHIGVACILMNTCACHHYRCTTALSQSVHDSYVKSKATRRPSHAKTRSHQVMQL